MKMHFRGKVCEGVDWIHLAQDTAPWRALAKTIMRFRVA
jgi:hypothetical protein